MNEDLDRWIAEKVMGWTWSDEHEMWVVDSERDADGRLTYCVPDELPGYEIEVSPGDAPDWRQAIWHPRSNIAQAFMVVERMAEFGFELVLVFSMGIFKYHAEFRRAFTTLSGSANANHPAQAICLAAKKALEEK
jgi:hypothetical protein